MIELSRHIESLMLKHDCVIVPGLGGFVTQYVPSRLIAEESLFLPPCRSVGFNQQLILNDGLLVQSYMQAYDTSYPETIKLIDEAVNQLKQTLNKEGEYELPGIGRLSLDMAGHYEFTPCEAGVLSPELYGLDSLLVDEIGDNSCEEENTTSHNTKESHKEKAERNYIIRINRELVNYAAAVAVAIIFYFIWAPSVVNTTPSNRQSAANVYEQLFIGSISQEASKKAEAKAPVQQTAAQPTDKKQEEKEAPANTDYFTLVLASSITLHNAQAYVSWLKEKGYDEAQSFKRGRMVRVIYGHYSTREEAQANLKKLRQGNSFPDAWIMQLK